MRAARALREGEPGELRVLRRGQQAGGGGGALRGRGCAAGPGAQLGPLLLAALALFVPGFALLSSRPSAAGREPGSSPSGPVIVLEAIDLFLFIYSPLLIY